MPPNLKSDVLEGQQQSAHGRLSEYAMLSSAELRLCGQVVLAGLLVLIPHMRKPLLAFQDLCQSFFALVGQAVELHPHEVARLPGENLCFSGAIVEPSCGRLA